MQSLFLQLLGTLVFFDALLRFRDFKAHYTEKGLVPLSLAKNNNRFSLCFLSPADAWQAFNLIGMAFFGACIVVVPNYISIFFAWIFTISIQNRNIKIICNADAWLRLTLFWSIWLPGSGGRFALIAQLCLVYWKTASLKNGDQWRIHKTAVQNTLKLDSFSSIIGKNIRHLTELLKLLTTFTIILEFLGPWLFLMPYPLPYIGFLLFLILQLGFLFVMKNLGIFPFISIIAMLPILDNSIWLPLTLIDIIPIILFLYCVAWVNIPMKKPWNILGLLLRLDQRWTMFAPIPLTQETLGMKQAKNMRQHCISGGLGEKF